MPGRGFVSAAALIAIALACLTVTRKLERERRLLELLRTPGMSRDRLVQAFLEEPLHRDDLASGFGTLYTAIYFPADGRAEYRWPDGMMMTQSFDEAKERL